MHLNTLEVATVPRLKWKARRNKKYTLLFVDLFSPAWAAVFNGMGMNPPPDSNHHWSVFNMNKTGVSSGTPSGPFLPSGNALLAPSQYAFLLFEHKEDINPTEALEYVSQTMQRQNVFFLATYMEKLGL